MLLIGLSVPAAFACPEEIIEYGPFELRTFSGRIEPPAGRQELPGGEVNFVVREKNREGENSIEWTVPVQPDGEFDLVLAEGAYEFSLSVEGFFFTLVGEFSITDDVDEGSRVLLSPPWC